MIHDRERGSFFTSDKITRPCFFFFYFSPSSSCRLLLLLLRLLSAACFFPHALAEFTLPPSRCLPFGLILPLRVFKLKLAGLSGFIYRFPHFFLFHVFGWDAVVIRGSQRRLINNILYFTGDKIQSVLSLCFRNLYAAKNFLKLITHVVKYYILIKKKCSITR